MPFKIERPTVIQSAGNKPKCIEEYVGRVNTGEERLSIARMQSPAGWREPGQRPEFDEYTIVLTGCLRVESEASSMQVCAGEAVLVKAGEWVGYSSPESDCEYIAICLPAFSPDKVHRDEE